MNNNDEEPELPDYIRETITIVMIGAVAAWMSLTVVKFLLFYLLK